MHTSGPPPPSWPPGVCSPSTERSDSVQAGRSEKSRRSGKTEEPSPSSYSKPGRRGHRHPAQLPPAEGRHSGGLPCGRDGKAEGHCARIPEPPSSQPAHFLPLPHPHDSRTHSHEHPGASARQAQGGTGGDPRAPSTRTVRYRRVPVSPGLLTS